MAGSMSSVPADELVLVMHFLDHVFPLQYPMYNPEALEGGRGWLLSLLLETEPLYHAVMALSAYHRRVMTFAKTSHSSQVAALVQQEKHLEICIKLVSQSTERYCHRSGLGIASTVLQLVFFEVCVPLYINSLGCNSLKIATKLFTGHSNAWQVHLRAAVNIFHRGFGLNLANFELAEKANMILTEERPPLEIQADIKSQIVSFRFLSAVTIWLDIISCVTAGTAPHLSDHNLRIMAVDSQTKLEDIMGCENEVLLQIGRIAALQGGRTRTLQEGNFDRTAFDLAANAIRDEMQRDPASKLSTTANSVTLITCVFAYMASIYLHIIKHGYQELRLIDTTISRATALLRTQIPTHLTPALVAPLFILGSAAEQEDEAFFRDIFSSPPLLDPSLQHRARILPILEEIWKERKAGSGFSWENCLDLTRDVLLI
jgi:C6 transcription factor Pro1